MAIGLLLGLLIGSGAVWSILQAKIQAAHDKAKADVVSERTSIVERMQAKDQQIEELKHSLSESGAVIERCHTEMKTEIAKCSKAETTAARIPELQNQLSLKDEQLQKIQLESSDLKAKISELEARSAEERRSAQEKLDLLNQAQQKLADAFKALSADALKSNNQSFMELATAQLEKFQATAQGDLTLRQQTIDELVKPLKVSLEKVDGKLQEIEKSRAFAHASAASQLNFRVNRSEFTARIVDFHLPIYTSLSAVDIG
jgi:DNA recombination protein RmuC